MRDVDTYLCQSTYSVRQKTEDKRWKRERHRWGGGWKPSFGPIKPLNKSKQRFYLQKTFLLICLRDHMCLFFGGKPANSDIHSYLFSKSDRLLMLSIKQQINNHQADNLDFKSS